MKALGLYKTPNKALSCLVFSLIKKTGPWKKKKQKTVLCWYGRKAEIYLNYPCYNQEMCGKEGWIFQFGLLYKKILDLPLLLIW